MIIKSHDFPCQLLQTEALDRRLPSYHPQKDNVSSKAKILRAGFHGEQSLDFPLSFLPKDKYLIFHNLRIPDSSGFFQLDALILSPYFILIIEVKNIYGNVIFDNMGQMIRQTGETEERFDNPIDQVNLQHFRLSRWLTEQHYPPIPIEGIVVYTNPTTILKNLTDNPHIIEKVMHKEKMLSKIHELSNKYPSKRFSEDQLREISAQLLSQHTPVKTDIMEKYQVKSEQLIKGIVCPCCKAISIPYHRGKWYCDQCGAVSRTAYLNGLADYALLINPFITNRQARSFLQITSISTMRKLLQKAKLKQFGTTSGSRYRLNVETLLSE
ncbi:NERD domain-containing protein [Oceanobacillus halotolerans]|uniref:NERD domain-containing protein n=1 Tax=Oceanobacillus halotolerans TaxID=2663380 RepID=UPI0013D913AE|nr:NERD domain-containing protein [Oceanobacillus halotolerans]